MEEIHANCQLDEVRLQVRLHKSHSWSCVLGRIERWCAFNLLGRGKSSSNVYFIYQSTLSRLQHQYSLINAIVYSRPYPHRPFRKISTYFALGSISARDASLYVRLSCVSYPLCECSHQRVCIYFATPPDLPITPLKKVEPQTAWLKYPAATNPRTSHYSGPISLVAQEGLGLNTTGTGMAQK